MSIDLVVRNPVGNVLLGESMNRPLQNSWFVPGGRILKDETFKTAYKTFKRRVRAE
ncbi:MAG: colanic acid biosynthesis protein WcaH [Psychroserpens sp.]|jgi:colanic acid biosynthesis protein WcaH